jgi:hypothetical protein
MAYLVERLTPVTFDVNQRRSAPSFSINKRVESETDATHSKAAQVAFFA